MNNEPVAWIRSGDDQLSLVKGGDDGYMVWNPLYTHPAKELHLSLQKSKETGELLAVTYTDDEHRIVEVLWQKPPTKTLTDEEILECWNETHPAVVMLNAELPLFARAILRKAQEK